MRLINALVMSDVVPTGLRSRLLRAMGVRLGPDSYLGSRTMLKSKSLTTGERCFVNHGCHIDSGPVTLGAGVYIGPGVMFLTNDHALGGQQQRAGSNVERPIFIGDGTWVGARAVILGGLSIAPGCVIAAGAVVTRDTTPNGLYVGVPARRIKDLS